MPRKTREEFEDELQRRGKLIEDLQKKLELLKEEEIRLNAEMKRQAGEHQAEIKKQAKEHQSQIDRRVQDKVTESILEIERIGELRVADKLSSAEVRATAAEDRANTAEKRWATAQKDRAKYVKGVSEMQLEKKRLEEQQQKQKLEHDETITALETERKKQQTLLADKAAAEKEAFEERQSQRTTYQAYRTPFKTVERLVELFLKYWSPDSDGHHERYWAHATRDFGRFRDEQAAKWSGLLDQIDRFIKDNSTRTTRINNSAQSQELGRLLRRARLESHGSRINTRLTRFETIQGTNVPRLAQIIRDTVINKYQLLKLTHSRLELERSAQTSTRDLKNEERLNDTIKSFSYGWNRLVSLRTSSLPDPYQVIAHDLDDMERSHARTAQDFGAATDRLRKVLGISYLPKQVTPMFVSQEKLLSAANEITENTNVRRLAQANRGTLPNDDVERAKKYFLSMSSHGRAPTMREIRQNAARRASRLENQVVEEDESSHVQAQIDEDDSILRRAKELAGRQLVTEDMQLASRMSRFISRFEKNNLSAAIQSKAVKQYTRSSLERKLDQALATIDPTKFGPISLQLNIALKTISRMYDRFEKSVSTRARSVRHKHYSSSHKTRSASSQKRAFSHVSGAAGPV
ncbi:hypothetical protein MBLNU457_3659t2 [Dothideomycetes sp. NU457]